MFHHVVPARAFGPEVLGPPLDSAFVPIPASMLVYSVGPASALCRSMLPSAITPFCSRVQAEFWHDRHMRVAAMNQ